MFIILHCNVKSFAYSTAEQVDQNDSMKHLINTLSQVKHSTQYRYCPIQMPVCASTRPELTASTNAW